MGFDLSHLFCPKQPIIIDIEKLPLIEIAEEIGVKVVFGWRDCYSSITQTIYLTELNYFNWFHELTHAIECFIHGKIYSDDVPQELESYVKLPEEIVANTMAIELCKKFNLPIDASKIHLKPQHHTDEIISRLESVRWLINLERLKS